MATVFEHLRVADLTYDELEAAKDCGDRVKALKFVPAGGYEVCDDKNGLEIASRNFITKFAPWSKFGDEPAKPAKLQAFMFKKSATLTVDARMLLIPTTTTTISGQPLEPSSYIYLTQNVSIQPDVLCLVFRAE